MNLTRFWQHIQRFMYTCLTTLPGGYRDKKLEILKHAFVEINSYMKQLKVEYWLDYGTLLGYYREKTVLPHDMDVDFGITESYFEKIWESRNLLPKGFRMYNTSINHRGPKLFVSYKGFDIDLYFYETLENTLATYELSDYPSETVPVSKELIFPIKEVIFLDQKTFVPKNTKSYLEHYYGYIGRNGIRNESTGYWSAPD